MFLMESLKRAEKDLVVKHRVTNRHRVVATGRPRNACNISTESVIRIGYTEPRYRFLRKGVLVEETTVYEMACDLPRTDENFFGAGEYYAEEETTGAYWIFKSIEDAEAFTLLT